MPPQDDSPRNRAAEWAWQRAQVDVLTAKLARAERAVVQARTATAAADAHRRADALLLELEAAEHVLRTWERVAPQLDAAVPAQKSRLLGDQGQLFDVC